MPRLLNIRGHSCFDSPASADTIIDCGGNRGDFASQAVARFGCRVISLEPNPAMADFTEYVPGTTLIRAALGAELGKAVFHLGAHSETSSLVKPPENPAGRVEVDVVTLDSLFRRFEISELALLKLDIEGAEVQVLLKTPAEILKRIMQITVEFHDFCGITTSKEIHQCVLRLKQLGFYPLRMTTFGHGDFLFVNRRLKKVSRLDVLWASVISKYARGIRRRLAAWRLAAVSKARSLV